MLLREASAVKQIGGWHCQMVAESKAMTKHQCYGNQEPKYTLLKSCSDGREARFCQNLADNSYFSVVSMLIIGATRQHATLGWPKPAQTARVCAAFL